MADTQQDYIYSEQEYGSFEGPFVIAQNKLHRSIKKRFTALRRLFTRPRGRLRERIFEYPLALAHLAGLNENSRVADIGGASSLLSLEAVYLGHEVEVVDLRTCPWRHPRLHSVQADLFSKQLEGGRFDAVVCISVIEHVGIERYGSAGKTGDDMAFMEELKRLLAPGGRLILSAPYGRGHEPSRDGYPHGYRVYDRQRLERLFEGLEVKTLRFFAMRSGVWLEVSREEADGIETARPVNGVFVAVLEV